MRCSGIELKDCVASSVACLINMAYIYIFVFDD